MLIVGKIIGAVIGNGLDVDVSVMCFAEVKRLVGIGTSGSIQPQMYLLISSIDFAGTTISTRRDIGIGVGK